MHESNGIDIIIALVLSDISPLSKHRMDLVLELKVRYWTLPYINIAKHAISVV